MGLKIVVESVATIFIAFKLDIYIYISYIYIYVVYLY
jgi:hypothetical protein